MSKGRMLSRKPGFTRKNVMALLGGAILAYYIVATYGSPPAAADVESVERQIAALRKSVAELEGKPNVPVITENWGRLLRVADGLGVFVKPVEQAGADRIFYDGPLKAWNGTVTGEVRAVLVTLSEAQRILPMYLYRYEIQGGTLSVDFSVVGG